MEADLIIVCIGGARHHGNLVDAVDEQNRVRVTSDLQVEGMPKVYCIGDANNVNETKLAYLAGKQAALVTANILNAANGKAATTYTPMDGQKEYGLFFLPMGPKIGVGAMGSSVMGSMPISLIKGKGLFSKQNFNLMGAPLPPV